MKGLAQWSKLPALGFIHPTNEDSLICSSHQSQATAKPTPLSSQPKYWEGWKGSKVYSTLFQVLTASPKLFGAESSESKGRHTFCRLS